MKKKILALLLAAVLALSLLPTAALADGPDYGVITNYEQLLAVKDSSSTYILNPAADFGWPEEETELSVSTTLQMRGDWTIPAQVTLDFSGSLTPDYESGDYCWRTLTVDGTLILYPRHAFQVYRMVIGGKLILNGYGASLCADEGELLSTGTLQLKSDISTYSFNLSDGPRYMRHRDTAEYRTHWVFHEGAQFLGKENSASAGEIAIPATGEENAPAVLLEAVGTVQCPYRLAQFTGDYVTLKGDWKLDGISVRGDSKLLLDGSASTRDLSLDCSKTGDASIDNDPTRCARITVPGGSTLALEKREDAPQFGASSDADGNTEILVNGTLRLGDGTRNDSELSITGTGTIDARARFEDGTNQPRFFTSDVEFTMTDVILDRAAYADTIAETITIERNWKLIPKILTQPQSVTVNAGEEAVFSVEARPAETYQWMYNTGTNTYRCTDEMGTGADTDTFRLIAKPEYDGYQFFCRVTSEERARTSDRATLTVLGPAVEITAQPQDYVGKLNSTATFTVAAEGDGLTYQWQISDDGENWTNSSVKTAKYSTKLTVAKNGRQVRCVVTDEAGNSLTSDAAVMKLSGPAITTQPKDYTGKLNSTATFTVAAVGEGLTYQWQVSDNDGSTWSNSSVKTAKYSTKLTAARDGRQVRCIVTDAEGNQATSEAAVMKLQSTGVTITAQPKDYTGKVNSTASFTVVAEGSGLTYQWQVSDDNGATWSNSSVKKAVYTSKLTAAKNGRQVRCIVTDANGNKATSTAATMRLSGPVITTQPKNYVGKVNSTASFTVAAEGSGLTYQWQVSDDNGATWSNSSVKKAVYTSKLTAAKDGRMVRCIVTDAEGNAVTTNAVTMKIG